MKTRVEIPGIITFTFMIDDNIVTFDITSLNDPFFMWIQDNPYKTNSVTVKGNSFRILDDNSVWLGAFRIDDQHKHNTNTPEAYTNGMILAIRAAAEAFHKTTQEKIPKLDQTAAIRLYGRNFLAKEITTNLVPFKLTHGDVIFDKERNQHGRVIGYETPHQQMVVLNPEGDLEFWNDNFSDLWGERYVPSFTTIIKHTPLYQFQRMSHEIK